MAIKNYGYLAGIFLIIGMGYSAFNNEILILRWPLTIAPSVQEQSATTKKKVKLSYWHHGAWHSETNEILWSTDKTDTLANLVKCWLNVLDEESMATKKISLQSIILTTTGTEAFVSFDHYPFAKDESTFEKWHWVEGLLKTLKDNGIALQSVRFLVHHQELIDPHLDFSQSWPIGGFIQ
jgi:hypothetical protein